MHRLQGRGSGVCGVTLLEDFAKRMLISETSEIGAS